MAFLDEAVGFRKECAAWGYAVYPGPVPMGSTHLGLTEGWVFGGVLRGAFSPGRGGWRCTMLQSESTSFVCWAGWWGGGGPWKQGRDETYGVLFTVPWRLRCNRTFNSTSFYILLPKNIHSYMLKWSLEPPKSHGETSSFCSACSAQIRADRCVCT